MHVPLYGHEGAFINIFIPIIDKCARVIARKSSFCSHLKLFNFHNKSWIILTIHRGDDKQMQINKRRLNDVKLLTCTDEVGENDQNE